MCYLGIVIYYQDVEIAVGLRSFTGGFGSFCTVLLQNLLWFEVFLAQWNVYLEARTLDSVSAIIGSDSSSMHLDEGSTEVQTNSGSFYMNIAVVIALIEALKETVGLFFLQSDTCIFYLDDGTLFVLSYDKRNVTTV